MAEINGRAARAGRRALALGGRPVAADWIGAGDLFAAAGAIAAALVTGERDAIAPETNEAMRISGLYHVLSISGLHMALVAGALFALIRGGLALVPPLALRRPIKKWAAAAALFGVSFYLVLSGGESRRSAPSS